MINKFFTVIAIKVWALVLCMAAFFTFLTFLWTQPPGLVIFIARITLGVWALVFCVAALFTLVTFFWDVYAFVWYKDAFFTFFTSCWTKIRLM